MKLLALTLLSLFCIVTISNAGVILNTLEDSDGIKLGWTRNLEGSFKASGGNTDKLSVQAGGRIIWRGNSDTFRLQGSASRDESNDVMTSKSVVGHLRHNKTLSNNFHSVAFSQIQHNPFQRLESRWLFGLGGRYDFLKDDNGSASFGATTMMEIENLEDTAENSTDQRLSMFLRLERKLNESVKVNLSGFYQPLWSDFSDARASGILGLKVSLTKTLSMKFAANLDYDSSPPAGVDKTDWTTKTGFGISF